MEEFTVEVLSRLGEAAEDGRRTLAAVRAIEGRARGAHEIPLVSELAAGDPLAATNYLLGEEPLWADLHTGRAIAREADERLRQTVQAILSARGPKVIVLVTGTAGSGKSTSLMRLALAETAAGRSVGWVDKDSDVPPREVRRSMERRGHPEILIIDDADGYGPEVASLAREIASGPEEPLIILGTRSTRAERIVDPLRQMGVPIQEEAMPHLTDADIGGLIDVLDRENRLGRLKGLPRRDQERAFREQFGRQLLVAMLQATSGRPFEERIVNEMAELRPDEREVYGLISIATALRHFLTMDEVLLAVGDASNATLNTVESLARRLLIVPRAGGAGFGTRHRVIAEVIFNQMTADGIAGTPVGRLTFMAASKVQGIVSRTARPWRMLRPLLNHDFLLRTIGPENARDVYTGVEALLHWDYHYLLQRGSLELEAGDIRLAENYLNQAYSLGSDDPLVRTEFAYLLLRLAVEAPTAPGAASRVQNGLAMLEEIIKLRGRLDRYPYHVLGSQGLAWSRRAALGLRERQSLLKTLSQRVGEGVNNHAGSEELKRLHEDLKKELMMTAVDYRGED